MFQASGELSDFKFINMICMDLKLFFYVYVNGLFFNIYENGPYD